VPPNHAATRPSLVSTIVDACADGKGARSKTNSALTIGDATGAWASAARSNTLNICMRVMISPNGGG
jgi:hypothetical protein